MGASGLRLLNLLRQSKPAFGTFMALKGLRSAQVVARTGMDTTDAIKSYGKAVIVDREHGYIGDSDMHEMVSAIASSGVSPIVRTRGPSSSLIKRALDTGAHGLIVPMVNNAADAKSIVASAKFPPIGIRGQGAAFPCFEHGLATPAEYVATANDNVLIMIQIESAEGLSNIEDVCQVDGIDLIFIGPNDLSLTLLGYVPPKYNEKVFLDAIDKIIKTAKKHGKKTGILAPDGETAKRYKDAFDFIAIGTDVRAMQDWFRTQLATAK